jgi:uncharacterized protein involved in exopolysaccharide biosynthesis
MDILIKYFRVLLKYRKLILYNVLIFTVVAAIISLILPQKFKATAQILPPSEESDIFGALSSSGLSIPKLSRLAKAGSFFGGSTPSDLIAVILQSRTVLENVVKDNDLIKIYKVKKGVEPAVKTLAQATNIVVGEEGVLELTVLAEKPKLAAAIANSYIYHVDKFLKESNMSRGHNMRIFIEKRLATAEAELKQASDSLRSFQEKNKLVSLDDEVRAVIDIYAKLKSELLKKEIELAISEDVSTQDNPFVLSTKREIDQFKSQLNEIETSKNVKDGFGAGFAVSFAKLPTVGQEYARRLRDYKVQEEVYSLLIQQYEQAKILEVRDTPTITILDYARVPERRFTPKRKLIVLFGLVLSLCVSAVYVLAVEYRHKLMSNTERAQEVNRISEILRGDFKQLKSIFQRKEHTKEK